MHFNLGTREIIFLAAVFLAGLLASAVSTLFFLRARGVLNENYRRHRRRKTDRNRLSRAERRVIRRAKRLRAAGKTLEAAKILEENGLLREAVYIADRDGMVLQAAEILMRAGKPHRAGAIYAKHKKWKEAIDCFVMAGMPYEVATCYRKLGDYKNACEYYKAAKRFGDAAWCYEQLNQFQSAARLFRLSEQPDRAAEQYLRLVTELSIGRTIVFDQSEIDFVVQQIETSKDADRFIALLRRANALSDLLKVLPRFSNQEAVINRLVAEVPASELLLLISGSASVSQTTADAIRAKLQPTGLIPQTIQNGSESNTANIRESANSRLAETVSQTDSLTRFDPSTSPIFAELPSDARQAVIAKGELTHLRAGQLLPLSLSHDSCRIHVVLQGEVEWRETRNGRGKLIQRRGPGTVIGLKYLLLDGQPSEQFVAYRDCEIWSVSTKDLEAVLDSYPTAGKYFYKAVARESYADDLTIENHKRLIA